MWKACPMTNFVKLSGTWLLCGSYRVYTADTGSLWGLQALCPAPFCKSCLSWLLQDRFTWWHAWGKSNKSCLWVGNKGTDGFESTPYMMAWLGQKQQSCLWVGNKGPDGFESTPRDLVIWIKCLAQGITAVAIGFKLEVSWVKVQGHIYWAMIAPQIMLIIMMVKRKENFTGRYKSFIYKCRKFSLIFVSYPILF